MLPGMLVQSVLFTAVYSGVALNTDITKGVVDRFRSLPIWRPAPLVGAVIGDSVALPDRGDDRRAARVHHGLRGRRAASGGVLAAVALVVVFAFGLAGCSRRSG